MYNIVQRSKFDIDYRLIKTEELPPNELMQKEIELFGFYVSNHPASKYNCVKFNNIKEYFDKNPYIKDAYLFISSIIKYITKKNSNPRHTNFL